MADIANGFNRKLDLITEREVVYDFVTRLSIGKDWTDPDSGTLIVDADINFKNILRQIAKSLPTSVYLNLQTLATTYANVSVGDTKVSANINGTLLLAISERTGLDLTDCFSGTTGSISMTVDVPYTNSDIIRFYSVNTSIT